MKPLYFLIALLCTLCLMPAGQAAKVVNQAGLSQVEAFLAQRTQGYNTQNLLLVMKRSTSQWMGSQLVKGYCGYPFERRQGWYYGLTFINESVPLPQNFRAPIAARPIDGKRGQWEYSYDQELITTPQEAMVWILGHEYWHYLCATGQAGVNSETNANYNGFKWLREFKQYQSRRLAALTKERAQD